ncbi:MAG: hypothetical protein QNJ60_17570 [Xenococcaceae cyanobacterium MO_188.B19]|nr:hypothetical protein [Xenococcaceae cyanobacterium MO_188.B19]
MKAIVANLLLGSMFYTLSANFSVSADSSIKVNKPGTKVLSAKSFRYDNSQSLIPNLDLVPPDIIFSLAVTDKDYLKHILKFDNWYLNQDTNDLNLVSDQFLPKGKKFKIHHDARGDLILGFHKTFWDSDNKQKYWGLTTVEQWGDGEEGDILENPNIPGLKLNQLNYKESAPLLAKGTKTLTLSGGGKSNLLLENDPLGEFENFRGGVVYHHGIEDDLTLGLGFFYEDFLSGFSQLTYQPNDFPLRTTISLITSEEGIDFDSHLQLKPSEDFVLNLYGNSETQKFDLNWGIASGITLTADGDSEKETLKAGAKIAFNNDFVSFLAKAELDNNNDLQWEISSKLGRLQLIHMTNALKSNSEIRYDLGDYSGNFEYAIFFKHQTQEIKKNQEQLAIWGWNFNSGKKVGNKGYTWEFEVGYGVGSQGEGAIMSATTAINSGLFLKLSYEDISLKSDETKIKLELTSK